MTQGWVAYDRAAFSVYFDVLVRSGLGLNLEVG